MKPKLSSPKPDTLRAFIVHCQSKMLAEPHFVALRRDTKRPAFKGWQSSPLHGEDAVKALDKYDLGLLPASIGFVVVDNDTGGQKFFDFLEEELPNALVAVTPSSSDEPGRGHAWVLCENAELVGAQRVRFNETQVGEFRASNAQIRLTEKGLARLLYSEPFLNVEFIEPSSAEELYRLLGAKAKTTLPTELGSDDGEELPESLSDEMYKEFNQSLDRSATVSRWCWKLASRGRTPAEILRHLSEVPEIIEKVHDKNFNLEADVLRCCGNFMAQRQSDFDQFIGDDMGDQLADWVWIVEMERFVRKSDGQMFSDRQFRSLFSHKMPGKNLLSKVWNNETPIQKFERAVYLPGEASVDSGVYNFWRPSGNVAIRGNTSLFEQHMKLLFPNEEEHRMVLDYLHYLVCHPGLKLNFALVIHGEPGIGKSLLGRLLSRLLGAHNVRFPSNEEINSRWSVWQHGVSLAIIEELMMNNRRDFIDRMKTVITEPTLRIEAKGSNLYSVPNRLNLLAFTNHDNALALDSNDRRWLVLSSPMRPQSAEYYQKLVAFFESDKGLAAILDFLQRHKPQLDAYARAPMTSAKQKMIEAAKPVWYQDLETAWLDQEGPFEFELFKFNDVVEFLRRRRHTVKNAELSKTLTNLGAVQHSRIKTLGQNSLRLWSRERHEHWSSSAQRRRQGYLDQLNYQPAF